MNPNPKLKYIRLYLSCPPQCPCKNDQIADQYCDCGKPLYLNERGDVFCGNQGCKVYFIKNYYVKCSKEKTRKNSFRSCTEFLMKFAMSLQSKDLIPNDDDLICLVVGLNQEVNKRWNS